MNILFDWADVPQHLMEDYKDRLGLVETLLDDSLTALEKKRVREEYCQEHGLTDRTIRNYIIRYKKGGAKSLLFYYPQQPAKRISDPELAEAILKLINERPDRSVRQLRYLLSSTENFKSKIEKISNRTIYRFLLQRGLTKKVRYALLSKDSRISYHKFQASCSLQLVQGDARDGIWINPPNGKSFKTYLFAWIDDYSRKILYAEYYKDEKLPRMEDSFKKMVLRWGIPLKVYLDNGNVYSSAHFAWVLSELYVKKIHHKPYAAYCKGKIEALMKTFKEFQKEADIAFFGSLDELNSALWAWIELVYNTRIHSSTGEQPNKRFCDGLPKETKRITDIAWFEALFLLRQERTVTKYGQIKLFGNLYHLKKVPHGTVVEIRFNPFDLRKIYVFRNKKYFAAIEANKVKSSTAPSVPEEKKNDSGKITFTARNYFTKLREQYRENLIKQSEYIPYSKLKEKEDKIDV